MLYNNPNRFRKKFNKLVDIDEDRMEFTFLQDVFIHEGNNFHGATGFTLHLVSKEEYEYRTDGEGLYEYLEDVWREQVYAGMTDEGLERWCQDVIYIDGDEAVFDMSYWFEDEVEEQIRELGYSEEEYPIAECIGGGRCFEADETLNNATWQDKYIVKMFESKNVSDTILKTLINK